MTVPYRRRYPRFAGVTDPKGKFRGQRVLPGVPQSVPPKRLDLRPIRRRARTLRIAGSRLPYYHAVRTVRLSDVPLSERAEPDERSRRGLIIFDGDDTLWETMPLYAEAKEAFFSQMAEWGFDPNEVRSRFDTIDADNVKRLGFTKDRFPYSMAMTYRVFCEEAGRSPTPSGEAAARAIGMQVFTKPSPLLPRVEETLKHLSTRFRLVLFTKGDLEVQDARVVNSGLGKYFDEVCIAADKTAKLLLLLATRHNQVPRATWVIGNSLKSDIKPALEAGMNAIWTPYETWIHEAADPSVAEAAIRCDDFGELPSLIADRLKGT